MKLLNGQELVEFIKERQAKQVRNLRQTWRTVPCLAVVQTIDDPVIDTYVRLKRRYADDIGIEFEVHKVAQTRVMETIDTLNSREDVHGIIVQLPLENSDETDAVVARVDGAKDVDGLGLAPAFDPATPLAIHWLLAGYGIELSNKKIAIVGNGRLVGKPLARMWTETGYDVTVFGSSQKDLSVLKQFDIIVTATGVPRLLTSAIIRPGSIVVDAGTAAEHGVIVGDVASELYEQNDLTITPVKGGVGPLTVAALFENVITAARRTTSQND